MSALTEGTYSGDWLIEELSAEHCHEAGTLASGQDLQSGTVVALGSGTTWSAYIDDDGTYGDLTKAGILLTSVDASTGAMPCVVVARGPATVNQDKLTWHANNDSTEITEGLAGLLALGIVCRRGV